MLACLPTNYRQVRANSLTQEALDIDSGFIFYPSGNADIEPYWGKSSWAGSR